jgi:hypothetical protein
MCCHHYHRYYRDWPGRCYSRRYDDWPAPVPSEDYVRQLEEERNMLERRLQRLEQALAELRRQTRTDKESTN